MAAILRSASLAISGRVLGRLGLCLAKASTAGLCLTVICGWTAQAQELRYAFPLPGPAVVAQKAGLDCGPATLPLVDMAQLFSFYAPGATQSVVDRQRMASYVARIRPSEMVKQDILRWLRRFDREPSNRQGIAGCLRAILLRWAGAGALLGNLDDNDRVGRRQAALIASWTAIAMANAFQAADDGRWGAGERAIVIAWFGRLDAAIRADFPEFGGSPLSLAALRSVSNHAHWAAAALGQLAVARADRRGFESAMGGLRRALASATPMGALEVELRRGGKALEYQAFALGAIALLVRLADANGRRLSAEDEARLASITRFTLDAWEDPALLQRWTREAQDRKPSMLAFAELLREHFADRNSGLAERLGCSAAPLRPFDWSFIGLDITDRVAGAGAIACRERQPKP